MIWSMEGRKTGTEEKSMERRFLQSATKNKMRMRVLAQQRSQSGLFHKHFENSTDIPNQIFSNYTISAYTN